MGYVYSALWVIIALMLFFRFRKENKVVYILSSYFIFLGVWWFLDEYLPGVNLTDGQYVWILRIVSAFMLGAALLVYFAERKRQLKAARDAEPENAGEAEMESE